MTKNQYTLCNIIKHICTRSIMYNESTLSLARLYLMYQSNAQDPLRQKKVYPTLFNVHCQFEQKVTKHSYAEPQHSN